jgi:hypothetical protein
MNTLVGFAYTSAPGTFTPGVGCSASTPNCGGAWMRVPYTKPSDALNVEFHEVKELRGPAGRVYKLRNHWPATRNPTYTGWVTWTADSSGAQWFHANGTEDEAALVRVEATKTAGEYVLLNLGRAAHPVPASSRGYISFADDGEWVRCNGYGLSEAMTVRLLKAGTPTPPAPPPTPPTPTPCAKKFDFRRLGLRVTAFLMSPYVPAGTVFQEPRGPYADSQFDLSSMAATIKHLFGVPGFLTQVRTGVGEDNGIDHHKN